MSASNLPEIATGITTVLGLLGFIIYAVIYFSDNASKSHLSKELIEQLKKTSLDPKELAKLPPSQVKAMIAAEGSVNKTIIEKGIEREIVYKYRFLITISIALLVFALIFGLVWLLKPDPLLTYNGRVLDEVSKKPVAGASVDLKNRPDIDTQQTDNSGLFQFHVGHSSFTLQISAKDYLPYSKLKTVTENNNLDTIYLSPVNSLQTRTLSGNVYDQSKQGEAIVGATVSIDGDTLSTETQKLGYFKIVYHFKNGDSPGIRVSAPGYQTYTGYFETNGAKVAIYMKK